MAAFNRDLLSRCVANYTAAMGALVLPVEEEQLEREDITAKAIAVEVGSVHVSAVCLCVGMQMRESWVHNPCTDKVSCHRASRRALTRVTGRNIRVCNWSMIRAR